MSVLKNLNDLNPIEINSLYEFQFFTDSLLLEANHVSDVTTAVSRDIYHFYLELIEDYYKTKKFPLEEGFIQFSGWSFNEYAENPDEIFYQTTFSDRTHHQIFMSVFLNDENNSSSAISRFNGRLKRIDVFEDEPEPDDIIKLEEEKYKDNDILVIAVDRNFIFDKNKKEFTSHIWLAEKIAHEITHLYRSAIAPHNNFLLSKKNDLLFKFNDDLKTFEPFFQRIKKNLVRSIRTILYNFDFNEQDARLKELDTHLREVLKREEHHKRLRQNALDYIDSHFECNLWRIDKISLITAISQTTELLSITVINKMHNTIRDLESYTYKHNFSEVVKFYVLGYYLYKSGNLYTKELKNHWNITSPMIGEFYSKDNYERLLKERRIDNLKQVQNIEHFFVVTRDSLEKIFLQYQAHVYVIIDKYLHQIYNVDESIDDEILADYVFERDLEYTKKMIEECREIYEQLNYYRNPANVDK